MTNPNYKMTTLYKEWDECYAELQAKIRALNLTSEVHKDILNKILELDALSEHLGVVRYLETPPKKAVDINTIATPIDKPYLCDLSFSYKLFKDGWQPLGPVLLANEMLIQSMVKYEPQDS